MGMLSFSVGRAGGTVPTVLLRQAFSHLSETVFSGNRDPGIGSHRRAPAPTIHLLRGASHPDVSSHPATLACGISQVAHFGTLLGLLTSTGLRIGEALRLTIRDLQVNREPSRLEIYYTKFRKSRFVPVHPTTADRLRTYLRQRYKLAGRSSTAALFLRAPDKPLHYGTALYCFHKITQFIGIPRLPGGRGPSLHVLRHTFAVRRLVCWYRAGLDVRSLLPHLAVYL